MTQIRTRIVIAAAALFVLAGGPAFADACGGRNHTGGALLGGLAGNALSRDMDCEDQPYAARAYDRSLRGPVGRRHEWRHGPDRGYIVTNREYHDRRGRLCRDFTQVIYRRGREFDRDGTACLRRNGEWELQ